MPGRPLNSGIDRGCRPQDDGQLMVEPGTDRLGPLGQLLAAGNAAVKLVLCWRKHDVFEYGFPVRRTSEGRIRGEGLHLLEAPVFVLSTGRCGTQFVTKLLETDRRLKTAHAPEPYLAHESRLCHELLSGSGVTPERDDVWRSLRELFLLGRMRQLTACHRVGRRWVETNNWITFMAPVIADVLPQARFVHLHRHPGDFVRSGMRRGWYTGGNPLDTSRPTPTKDDPAAPHWGDFSLVEKIAWLWQRTNGFIESFKSGSGNGRTLTLGLGECDEDGIRRLCEHVDAHPSARRLRRLLRSPVKPNAQREGSFPELATWGTEDRNALKRQCGLLSEKYGYDLIG